MTETVPSTPDVPSWSRSDDVAALRARIGELEQRLSERVDEIVVLHEETRVLQQERSIRDEFIRSMEADVMRLPAAERQLIDTDNAYKELHARFEAFRLDTADQVAELERQVDSAQRRMTELDSIIVAFEHRRAIILSKRVRRIVRQVPGATPAARAIRGAPPVDQQR